MKAQIFHNPRCSKSREALALLQERGVALEVIDYQANPPGTETLRELTRKLGLPARELVRFADELAIEMDLSARDDRSENQWLQLLSANPRLIERPIVVAGHRAVIGRPPAKVLTLF
jgi:arsenate reductase